MAPAWARSHAARNPARPTRGRRTRAAAPVCCWAACGSSPPYGSQTRCWPRGPPRSWLSEPCCGTPLRSVTCPRPCCRPHCAPRSWMPEPRRGSPCAAGRRAARRWRTAHNRDARRDAHRTPAGRRAAFHRRNAQSRAVRPTAVQLLGVRAWLRLHFVLPDAALPGAAVPMAMPPATLLVPLRDA